MRLLLVTLATVAGLLPAASASKARPLHGFGLSLSLPPGWVGDLLPGEIAAIAPEGAVVQLDDALVWPQRYVQLPLRVRAGTTRLFVAAGGREFFLFVHTTRARLVETNRVLASVRVLAWTAPLAAPRFVPSRGWQIGQSGPKPLGSDAFVSAWASTVPYLNSPVDLPPEATLARAGSRGVVVWVGLVPPRQTHPFPVRKDPLDLGQAFCTRTWEGALPGLMQCTLWSHLPGRFELSLYVYVKSRSLLSAAQAELRRVLLPSWPRSPSAAARDSGAGRAGAARLL